MPYFHWRHRLQRDAVFPFVTAPWMAFLFMWLLDASNNTAMEPHRAFISDRLPKNQLARGFLIQSMFVGLGAVLANLSLLVFQKVVEGGTAADSLLGVRGLLGWGGVLNRIRFGVGALHQGDPSTDEELAELRARPKGAGAFFREIASAVKEMPVGMLPRSAWSSCSSGSRWRSIGSSSL